MMPQLSAQRAFLNDIEGYLKSLIWLDIIENKFFVDDNDKED